MQAEKEDEILRRALREGRLTPGEAERLRIEAGAFRRLVERLGPSVTLLLVARRLDPQTVLPYLDDPEAVALVRRLQDSALLETDAGPPSSPTRTLGEAESSEAPPVGPGVSQITLPGLDRYVILQKLAQGGTATVFKALDPRLNRPVALKVLWGDTGGQVRRILREAQAQAKVEHENVCRVYEVGEAGGLHYIAMQYIEGFTLDQVQKQLTLEQKVRLVKRVAEALHAAHRQGLIHRDIKPSNIMVELTEDGDWHPYVLDFGLAREIHPSEATLTHVIVGTPQYMAPEQARGEVERLDRRTDVYSLGATLYELLVGRPPFEGSTPVEVLMRVLSEEPTPPRKLDPSIPVDLETIVLKCLEKDPQRRYESARALADDLGRYLDGEPILARPAGWTYRLWKRARKHKALLTAVGAVLFVVTVLLALNVRTQLRARRQAALAQRLGQTVQAIEGLMQMAFLLPPHDIRREKALVMERIREIEGYLRDRDPIFRGPAAYALGRAYLALQDYDRARTLLQTAWDAEYREPAVAYALGLTLSHLYRRELEALDRIGDPDLREARRRELAERYRTPILQFLRQGRSVELAGPAYVEALVAFYERRYDEALTRVRAAAAQNPWPYEERLLEAEVLRDRGVEAAERGRYDEAQDLFRRAESVYRGVLEIARSFPSAHGALCRLAVHRLDLAVRAGQDPEPPWEAGRTLCQRALQVDPEDAYTYARLAELHWRWALYEYQHGQDPSATLEAARRAAETVIRLRPDQAIGYEVLGDVYEIQGSYMMAWGMDAGPAFEKALENYQKALQISPDAAHYNMVGLMYGNLLQYELERGRAPADRLRRAAEAFQMALRLNPSLYNAYSNLGRAYRFWGESELRRGRDPTTSLAQALDAYRRSLQINPNHIVAYFGLGKTHQLVAEYRMATCASPEEALQASVEAFREALRRDARYIFALYELGQTFGLQARHQMTRGQDPWPTARQALEFLDRAVEVNPREASAYAVRSRVYQTLALDALRRGEDPAEFLNRAVADGQAARQANPNLADAVLALAEAWLSRAAWDLHRGRPPMAALAEARAVLQAGLGRHAHDFRLHRALGQAALLEGRWHARTGRAPDAAWDEALRHLRDALERNPNDAETHRFMAETYRRIAEYRTAHGQDSTEARRQAAAAVEKVQTLCPDPSGALSRPWTMDHRP
ncbi:Serine/threonine-protein kinase PknB [bacterium HR11]|nr:Serine/threonine-protein kinase PknB [bacterium HR11]